MTGAEPALVLQAIDALKRGERREAAALLQRELDHHSPSPDRCRTISRLAAEIGEIDMVIDAARRSAQPTTLLRLLYYWGMLATYGRSDEAIAQIDRLPAEVRNHRAVLQFRGTISGENGRFGEAEELLRRALAQDPNAPETWFALTTVKTFEPGDRDLEAMESLLARMNGAPPPAKAQLLYALGKAWDDCGDYDRAYRHYQQGAAIRRESGGYDEARARSAAERILRDFTPEKMSALVPAQATKQRSLFVTGLPRSGTTLVQQMLAAHSRVSGGDEVNLMKPALIPTIDFSFEGALAYQKRAGTADPWADVACDYARFIDMRFRTPGLIVDKSLGQSALMGLMLHCLPDARIIWVRRNPEDTALSCFRTSFTASTHWSWSVSEIANHFRIEDRLFDHWRGLFGERILVVPYEDLVRDPRTWMESIARHVRLEVEPAMERFHENRRTVRTASVKQVRSPVTTARIGAAQSYPQFTEAFRAAYRG
jgi:tetratricopeptide (TPR) repeat protein